MKRKITIALTAFALMGSALAQNVPNGSFENGTTSLDGWVVLGGTLYNSIDVNQGGQTTKRYPTNGARFLGVKNTSSGGGALPGYAGTTFALTTKPATLRFDAMYFRSAAIAEPWTVFVFFWNHNGTSRDTVLYGSTVFAANTVSNWSNAVLDLMPAYRAGSPMPDSAIISFFINPVGGQLSNDANLFLDGVRLSEFGASASDLTPEKWGTAFNNTIYPNPVSSGTANISFETLSDMDVKVQIYDLNGRLIQEPYSGSLSAGKQNIDVNTSNLTSGIYIYKIVTANGTSQGKLVVE